MSDYSPLEYLKVAIYYASFLYFPVAPWLILRLSKEGGRDKLLSGAALAALSVLSYARFVEPRILLSRRHDIALDRCFDEAGAVRLAVFFDAHIGLRRNPSRAPVGPAHRPVSELDQRRENRSASSTRSAQMLR